MIQLFTRSIAEVWQDSEFVQAVLAQLAATLGSADVQQVRKFASSRAVDDGLQAFSGQAPQGPHHICKGSLVDANGERLKLKCSPI